MFKKFVKDRAHNRYEAYCCEDIDKLLGALSEAVAALVAQTVPDKSVTLEKLAEDARTYTREINHGALFCEWVGTYAEYTAHLAANGGQPIANVRYTITDHNASHVNAESVNAGKVKANNYIYHEANKTSSSQNRIYIDVSELEVGGLWFFAAYYNANSGAQHIEKSSFLTLFLPPRSELTGAKVGGQEICLGAIPDVGKDGASVKIYLHCENENPYFYVNDTTYTQTTLNYAVKLPIEASFPTIDSAAG